MLLILILVPEWQQVKNLTWEDQRRHTEHLSDCDDFSGQLFSVIIA